MANWIRVDQDAVGQPAAQKLRGVDVTVYFSPFDVPPAVRGNYDSTRKSFVIQFNYFSAEEELQPQKSGQIVFKVGKRSRRLYEIEIDVDAIGAKTVGLKVSTANAQHVLDAANAAIEVISQAAGQPAKSNYIAARGAISQVEQRLVDSFVGSH
jgi:hypothetical protein